MHYLVDKELKVTVVMVIARVDQLSLRRRGERGREERMARSVTVTVTVREYRKVRSPRSEAPLCFLRLEHGARVLGEGARVTCEAGEGVMGGGVEGTIHCNHSQRESVDELLQNPIIVSLWEVLPKDKKSKEEKTAELGHVTFDLLPLVCGQRGLQVSCGLEGESRETEVEVVVKASEDLVSEEQLLESNVLFLRVRSLHSLPPSWSHTHSPSSLFTLSTPHPLSGPPLSISGAPIKGAESGEGHTHWRWPGGRGDGSESEKWALEDESGEFKGQEDIPFRRSAECDEPRVDWGMELRTWLPPSGPSSLILSLTQSPFWPVEMVRCTPSPQAGKSKTKEEETISSHHGVAYLNLAPLLYPGTTRLAGAFSLHPFSEADVVSKTKRDYSSLLSSSPSLTAVKKMAAGGGKPGRKLDSALKSGSMVSQASEDHTTDTDRPTAHDTPSTTANTAAAAGASGAGGQDEKRDRREGVVYEEARSYVWVEVELLRPLVPQRPLSALAQRVSEYIPERPAVPRREGGAERALNGFRDTTAAIVGSLLQDYRETIVWGGAGGGASTDERKQLFLQHLNSTGQYHRFKEQLKHAVVGVVRERYGNRTGFFDSAHCHAFLSQLYTFLSDQLHVSMSQAISLDDPPEATPTPVDFDLLKHFAQEAEDFKNFQLAERYYQERVGAADHVAQHWYDYGVFCLLIGQLDKAEQCLKESLALDQQMIPALLLYGMLNTIGERYDKGSEFMELATTSDLTNIVAWCMRGLCYELQTERVLEEMCYEQAVCVWRGREGKTFISREREGQRDTERGGQRDTERGGQKDSERGGQRDTEREDAGDVRSGEGMAEGGERSELMSTSGGEQAATGDTPAGEEAPEDSNSVQPEDPPTSEAPPPTSVPREETKREDPRTAVFLQTASFLLDNHAIKFSKAKEVYLRACRDSPSAASWRGVGVACYKLGELGEAEAALSEANILNNRDPLTWGYLALLCLKTERPVDAEQALKFAVKTGLETREEVVEEIRQEMTSHKRDPAHQHIPHLLTQLVA